MKNLREMIANNEQIKVEDVTAENLMLYFVDCAKDTFDEWEKTARIEPELADFYKFREGYVRIKENEDIIFDLFSLKQLKEIAKNIKETADSYKEKGADVLFSVGRHEAWIKALSSDTSWSPDGIMQTTKFIRVFETKLKSEIAVPILNTTILTNDGDFSLKTISLEKALKLLEGRPILSAVGHQSTADILTELLGTKVPMNRIQFKQEPGQSVLCFKLNGRPEEGKILSREEIESIGYEFKLLEMK